MSHANDEKSEIVHRVLNRRRSTTLPVATVIFPNDSNDPALSLHKETEGLVINGKSSLTANPDLSEIYCIFIQEDLPGHHVSCAIIDKSHPGIRLGEKASLSGLKAICFQDVIFDQAKISNDAVVAAGEEGKSLFDRFLNVYYGFVAAIAMGTARTAFAKALAYAKDRYQFGKKIILHQEIQRMLGSMRMKIDMGTAGYIQAFTANRVNLPGVSADGRLAKAFCTQAALEIVFDAIQIHGGYGYMNEYGLEKIMRDVKILQLLGGRNPYHHIQIIAEELKND
jgi:acyl-CoA dehydrogenase